MKNIAIAALLGSTYAANSALEFLTDLAINNHEEQYSFHELLTQQAIEKMEDGIVDEMQELLDEDAEMAELEALEQSEEAPLLDDLEDSVEAQFEQVYTSNLFKLSVVEEG